MSKKVFKVGDRVSCVNDGGSGDFRLPTSNMEDCEWMEGVIETVMVGRAQIKWDDVDFNDENNTPIDMKLLFDPAEAKKERTRLEKEFKLVEKEVAAKLKEAGKLLKDANKIAKKTGNNLSEMYSAIQPLYSAMNSCGWRTSSFGC